MAAKRPRVVIATHNAHKVVEIRKILGRARFNVVGLENYPAYTVRETGKTLEANALLKARAAVRRTGEISLADDTGLEVKALDGAPGVTSARFSGPRATYESNNRLLLSKLAGLPASKRTAVFRCVVACVFPDGRAELFEGRCPGRIAQAPKGGHGFGYDPVFVPNGQGGKTFAEMTLSGKNAISHRSKAFRQAALFLNKMDKTMKE